MQLTQTKAVLLTLVVVASSVAALPAAGAALTQQDGGPPEPDREQREPSDGANFTVVPKTQSDRVVGTEEATYLMLSKGEGPWDGSQGLETIDYYKITSQQADFSACNPNNAQAFGIDRGNNLSGTGTDEALLQHMENNRVGTHTILVEIYDEGSFAGEPTYLNREDETVAQLGNCIENTGPEGWYQFKGYVNGTNYQGEFQEVLLYSEYFYICDCASEAEAEEQLGPKPYSDSDSDGSGSATATPTPTPTATPTPEPDSGGTDESSDADTSTPAPDGATTATATPTPTATATATATPTATATATATPTPTATATATATPTATATTTATSGGSGTATATSGGNGGGGQQSGGQQQSTPQSGDGPLTPTAGSGPGFGALAALGALVAAALIALRRD